MTQFHRKVRIPSGTIEVDIWIGNPFDMEPDERAVMFQIVDAVTKAASDWDQPEGIEKEL